METILRPQAASGLIFQTLSGTCFRGFLNSSHHEYEGAVAVSFILYIVAVWYINTGYWSVVQNGSRIVQCLME